MVHPLHLYIMTTINEARMKVYTVSELANLYDVCPKTFRKWLTPYTDYIGEKNGRFYTILQVAKIFEKLGRP